MFHYRICLPGDDRNQGKWMPLNDQLLITNIGCQKLEHFLTMYVFNKTNAYTVMNVQSTEHLICTYNFSLFCNEDYFIMDIVAQNAPIPYLYVCPIINY